MARKRVRQEQCPNCARALSPSDNYCSNCGQENHTHRLPLGHFLVELLSGLFNFDTKLVRTLKDLFIPPGRVIREFNSNRRARYVPPLRLYLFTSVLFFILLAWTTSRIDNSGSEVVSVVRDDEQGTAQRNGLTLDLGGNEALSDSMLTALSSRAVISDAMLDSTLLAIGSEPAFLNRLIIRMAINGKANSPRKARYVERIFSAFSKLMFLLLPLFALLLFFLYRGTGRYFTEHLVFTLYFHTVVFIGIGLRSLTGLYLDPGAIESVLPVLLVGYLVWAMHTVYGQSWGWTFLKMACLLIIYFILLLAGFAVAAVIGSL